MRNILQISGPPCAGKSTALRAYRQHTHNTGIYIDEWEYMQARGVPARDATTPDDFAAYWAYLDRIIQRPGIPIAYLQGNPRPRRRWVRVKLLDPGQDECHRRAEQDQRPAATHTWIDQWYAKYGRPR